VLADLSGRLEAAKPPAPAELILEDLELAQPAKVVTLTDAVPGFEPTRSEEPAPVAVEDLGHIRADGIWCPPDDRWLDDAVYPFRGAVMARQRAYGPSGCPPGILMKLMTQPPTPIPPPANDQHAMILQLGMSEWGLH
jgi:hypothetical protein